MKVCEGRQDCLTIEQSSPIKQNLTGVGIRDGTRKDLSLALGNLFKSDRRQFQVTTQSSRSDPPPGDGLRVDEVIAKKKSKYFLEDICLGLQELRNNS